MNNLILYTTESSSKSGTHCVSLWSDSVCPHIKPKFSTQYVEDGHQQAS